MAPARTATTSLQNTISRLRKLLGADRLVTKPPGYAIRLEPEELDLTRFERIVAAARETHLSIPLVVRLEGNNVQLGKQILADSGLSLVSGGSMADAAEKVVRAVAAK